MIETEGGAPTANVGDVTENPPETKPDLVSKQDLDRALSDLHKFKSRTKELQSELEKAQSTRLKEKEDYKTLSETYEKNWQLEKDEHSKTRSQVEYNQKYNAVYSALKKEGLMEEAEKLLDRDQLEDLVLEKTDQGRYIVHGKDAVVARWKKDFPFAFKKEAPPKINGGGGQKEPLTAGDVTIDKVFQAEKDYKAGKIPQSEYVKVVHLFKNRKKA